MTFALILPLSYNRIRPRAFLALRRCCLLNSLTPGGRLQPVCRHWHGTCVFVTAWRGAKSPGMVPAARLANAGLVSARWQTLECARPSPSCGTANRVPQQTKVVETPTTYVLRISLFRHKTLCTRLTHWLALHRPHRLCRQQLQTWRAEMCVLLILHGLAPPDGKQLMRSQLCKLRQQQPLQETLNLPAISQSSSTPFLNKPSPSHAQQKWRRRRLGPKSRT